MLDLERGSRSDDFNSNLLIVSNEIGQELKILPDISFANAPMLTPEKVTPEIISEAAGYVEAVRRYYVRFYNEANSLKDLLITTMEEKDKSYFQKLRNDHSNVALEEFVTAKNETQKIIEYKNELVRKLDPIFMDPGPAFIKAHFYSPEKRIFGRLTDTYVVNVAVIWFMTLVLYIILYFRLLHKLLVSFESLSGKRNKTSDKET